MQSNYTSYTLTADGKETRFSKFDDKTGTKTTVDMNKFWEEHGEMLKKIVSQKVDGWDQLRVQYSMTCQPIYDFVVHDKEGNERKFGIYGSPFPGCALEDGKGPLPEEYLKLFNFMMPKKK
jgi:hypothetical protein